MIKPRFIKFIAYRKLIQLIYCISHISMECNMNKYKMQVQKGLYWYLESHICTFLFKIALWLTTMAHSFKIDNFD